MTVEAWEQVAKDRYQDAQSLHEQGRHVAAVYMAGYAIECYLKAYLQDGGRKVPTSGPEGHNLGGLWQASGFRLADLQDTQGTRSYFITQWNTGLRYCVTLNTALATEALVRGAGLLVAWIAPKLRRFPRREQ